MKITEKIDNDLLIEIQFDSHEERNKALRLLKFNSLKIKGYKRGSEYLIDQEYIYCIESIDKTTIIYTANEEYNSTLWLYQIEELLDDEFIRV
ncbi:MAG: LytTR family transcriptional regulator DNA-binding domain-containing protein, partial [Coprobacillaceae bacterium]